MHLVLDLDETLISVSLVPDTYDFAFVLQGTTYYGKKRPHLDLFLTYVFDRFETVNIWTAATADYANQVIKNIMTPEQIRRLAFVKTRKDLVQTKANQGHYKPLRMIFNSPDAIKLGITPSNTIMIDDRSDVLRDNPGNGIVVPAWKGNKRDRYLASLLIVLDGILHHNLGFGQGSEVIDLRSIVDVKPPASAGTVPALTPAAKAPKAPKAPTSKAPRASTSKAPASKAPKASTSKASTSKAPRASTSKAPTSTSKARTPR